MLGCLHTECGFRNSEGIASWEYLGFKSAFRKSHLEDSKQSMDFACITCRSDRFAPANVELSGAFGHHQFVVTFVCWI
jgi:hypothetical protein